MTTTILNHLNSGIWPVNACLRWNTLDDIVIESGLNKNTYAHEIQNIRDYGAFGYGFEDEMTIDDVNSVLRFIVENYED